MFIKYIEDSWFPYSKKIKIIGRIRLQYILVNVCFMYIAHFFHSLPHCQYGIRQIILCFTYSQKYNMVQYTMQLDVAAINRKKFDFIPLPIKFFDMHKTTHKCCKVPTAYLTIKGENNPIQVVADSADFNVAKLLTYGNFFVQSCQRFALH